MVYDVRTNIHAHEQVNLCALIFHTMYLARFFPSKSKRKTAQSHGQLLMSLYAPNSAKGQASDCGGKNPDAAPGCSTRSLHAYNSKTRA